MSLVRCGDVTGDGASDAVYTLASGGTAGDTRFGVLAGNADGTLGKRIFFKSGYKVGIARHSSRSFDVLQPFYEVHRRELLPELVPPDPLCVEREYLRAGQGEEAQEGAGAVLPALTR